MAKVLYITYLGLLEPLPKSQVLPYLFGLSHNNQIHLLSFEKKYLIQNNPDALPQIQNVLQDKGIIWHRLKYHKYPLVLTSLWDIAVGTLCSFFIIIRYRISIVHARADVPLAIAYLLKHLFPVKVLYDRRAMLGEEHLEFSGWKKDGFLHRLGTWFERLAMRKSDCIVSLSQKASLQLAESRLLRDALIKTIPCSVDLELFNFVSAKKNKDSLGLSDNFVFVYSGSVGTYNLLPEMFDFFQEALRIIPNAHFLILTQNKPEVTEFLESKGCIDKHKVTITYVEREELPGYFSVSDAALLFRRPSYAAQVASPAKFAEYLACGLPVVSTPRIGDLEGIIRAHKIGVVIQGFQNKDYREAIIRLLALMHDKETLKKRCRKVAEELFSLEEAIKSYRHVYNKLAEG